MISTFYPMKLRGVPTYRIWGGSRLRDLYGKIGADEKTGESWELSVREKERSIIENGAYAGRTLYDFLDIAGNSVVSADYSGGRFPLLTKLIDAADKLSVQVHPDDSYAKIHEGDLGKTEMWYIVDALPGSEIVYGLKPGLDSDDLRRAVEAGRTEDSLNFIKVKPGECYFIPAGLVHAIGNGILIAEIQQNSDLTYRLYDYCRRDSDGKLRELHIDKALDVTKSFTPQELNSLRFGCSENKNTEQKSENVTTSLLAHCEYFKVLKYSVASDTASLEFSAQADSFHSLLIVGGEGSIHCEGTDYHTRAGDSWFIPAGMGDYTVSGNLEFLFTTLK